MRPVGRLACGAAYRWVCAPVLWLIIAAGGCDSGGSSVSVSDAPPGPPAQHPMLEGVPVPSGFRVHDDRSRVQHSAGSRWAEIEFRGDLPPERVISFYQHYMPAARFSLKSRSLDRGETVLCFESDREECKIRTRRGTWKTILIVEVNPLPRGAAERGTQSAPVTP